MDVYKGPLDEKEWENVKDDEYLKLFINVVEDRDNICFYKIDDLDDNEVYNIRLRAILKDDGINGQYSKWLTFTTKKLGSDDEDTKDDVVPYTAEVFLILLTCFYFLFLFVAVAINLYMIDLFFWWKNKKDEENLEKAWNRRKKEEITEFDGWLKIFENIKLGLSQYDQRRVFYCMKQIEKGEKIDSGDFANFVLSVGQRFDSQQWRDMCKTVREKILNPQ